MKTISECMIMKNMIQKKIDQLMNDQFFLDNIDNSRQKIEQLRKNRDSLDFVIDNFDIISWFVDDNRKLNDRQIMQGL